MYVFVIDYIYHHRRVIFIRLHFHLRRMELMITSQSLLLLPLPSEQKQETECLLRCIDVHRRYSSSRRHWLRPCRWIAALPCATVLHQSSGDDADDNMVREREDDLASSHASRGNIPPPIVAAARDGPPSSLTAETTK